VVSPVCVTPGVVHRVHDDTRMRTYLACLVLVAGCGFEGGDDGSAGDDDVGVDPDEIPDDDTGAGDHEVVPDVRCAGAPATAPGDGFRHVTSDLLALGTPYHRGIDLITTAAAEQQVIEGVVAYTLADSALEDEDVEVFACRAGAWELAGTARSDESGRFELVLDGERRLPIGVRDLYVSVVGDRTGAGFLALVGYETGAAVITDVDGTLTGAESQFMTQVLLGGDVEVQPGAPEALAVAADQGYTLIYLTARGSQFTGDTRAWLDAMGFPRGPLRLSPSFVTLPGDDTVTYKVGALRALGDAGIELAAGVGNRASDVDAYRTAGVLADRIFIKLPEYEAELAAALADGKAIGFASYDVLGRDLFPGM
jgi:hypothetical protein